MPFKQNLPPEKSTRSITATEAARNFSDLLNQVRYRSIEFDIVRGKEVVARVVPAKVPSGLPVARLNELFRALPRLDEGDADEFMNDVRAARSRLTNDSSAWG